MRNAAKARVALAAARANGTVKKREKRERKPNAAAVSVWRFNIDDQGELSIVDQEGSGIELTAADSVRLRNFLARCVGDV